MKMKCILLIGLLLGCVTAFAQAPTLINYQGRLVDASGEPLQTANRNLVINIFDTPTGNTKLYGPQEFSATPVVNGYFNILIGPVDESGKGIESAFMGGDAYLDITVNGTPMSPRQRIVSAPYALRAMNSDHAETAASVEDNGVTRAMILNDAIDASKIQDGSIGSAEIASGAVGAEEIGVDAVGSAEIQADAVGSSEIAASAVGASEIASSAVNSDEIAAAAVGSEEIANGAVTTEKFAANAEAPTSQVARRIQNGMNIGLHPVSGQIPSTSGGQRFNTGFEKYPDLESQIATSGNPVWVTLRPKPGHGGEGSISADSESSNLTTRMEIKVTRQTVGGDSVDVYHAPIQVTDSGKRNRVRLPPSIVSFIDDGVAPGTHIYTVWTKQHIGAPHWHQLGVTELFVLELGVSGPPE